MALIGIKTKPVPYRPHKYRDAIAKAQAPRELDPNDIYQAAIIRFNKEKEEKKQQEK